MRVFLFNLVTSNILFWLSLYSWKIIYNFSDFAILTLFPLFIFISWGSFWYNSKTFLARRAVVVKPDSKFFPWLRGRIRAILIAFFVSTFSITILAWQALTLDLKSFYVLVLQSLFVSVFLQIVIKIFTNHFYRPFPEKLGILILIIFSIVIFFPILSWVTFNFVDYPSEFQYLKFKEIILFYTEQNLPARRGSISEILAIFYSIDAVLLWLIAQNSSSWWAWWAPYAFSIKAGLITLVFAQSIAILNIFILKYIENFSDFTQKDS